MQLMLITGIIFAIGAVLFALQNNEVVVVTLALWRFEGSLAIVLLVAVGVGVLITALLTTPAVVRAQWSAQRSRRQLAERERELAEARALAARSMPTPPAAEPEKPYVGLRTLLASGEGATPPTER